MLLNNKRFGLIVRIVTLWIAVSLCFPFRSYAGPSKTLGVVTIAFGIFSIGLGIAAYQDDPRTPFEERVAGPSGREYATGFFLMGAGAIVFGTWMIVASDKKNKEESSSSALIPPYLARNNSVISFRECYANAFQPIYSTHGVFSEMQALRCAIAMDRTYPVRCTTFAASYFLDGLPQNQTK